MIEGRRIDVGVSDKRWRKRRIKLTLIFFFFAVE